MPILFERAYYFALGMIEFRSDFTRHPYEHVRAYDLGRELAHRLTGGRYGHFE